MKIKPWLLQFSSVQLLSHVQLFVTPWTHSTTGFSVHHQLPELAQTHVHRVSDAIEPSHPLSSPFPPAFNLSQKQGLYQWVSSLHQVAKVLAFQLQHQSLNEYSGLTPFRIDWFDFPEAQETLKSLLQGNTLITHKSMADHVNVWQKPLQYCKVTSLQWIKINGRKKKSLLQHHSPKVLILWCSASSAKHSQTLAVWDDQVEKCLLTSWKDHHGKQFDKWKEGS